jgi:F0F1-type ATP synthase epsilon subunit
MELYMVTPSGLKFHGPVRELVLPTAVGQVTILPHHEPYTALINAGEVIVRATGGQRSYKFLGGVFDIKDNLARLVVREDTAETDATGVAQTARQRADQIKASVGSKARLHQAQEILEHRPVLREASKFSRRHRHHSDRGEHLAQ